MATQYINSQWTYLERAKGFPEGGMVRSVIDVMDQQGVEDFLRDWPVFPANLGLKHQVKRTTNRPPSTRRSLYQGVKPNITTKQIVLEPVVLFEQRSEIDEDSFAGMDAEAKKDERRIEAEGHIKGLQEDLVYSLFNDSRASGSEYIDGFGVRLNTLSYPGYSTSTLPYVWDMGGSGSDVCSAYITELGPRACYGVIPGSGTAEGRNLGVAVRDKGTEPRPDSNDNTKTWYALVEQFKLWAGIACADDRKITRIANIESSESAAKSWSGGTGENILIKALSYGRFNTAASRMYVGPQLYAQLCIAAKDRTNQRLDWDNIFGKRVLTVWGIPVRKLDEAILSSTETALT